MDPITAAALSALAGTLGSESGRQVWQGLVALVRRPFRRGSGRGEDESGLPGISSGERELAALEEDPSSPAHAQALATALGVRAALDGEFGAQLEEWWLRAQTASGGEVHNHIGNATVHGSVFQGRDFSDITFNSTRDAPPAAGSE